jgi:cellulose synthase/poly-beta-1,6-N-acetylglucosamine synthase-like glycosyltransferase
MPHATEILFWTSLFIIFYTYAGYPLLLLFLVLIKKIIAGRPENQEADQNLQPVTLIVTAFNEEEIIEEKIKNTLSLNYPADLISLMFITDGSTDQTPLIVGKYPGVELLHHPERKGKLEAMNRAMQFVKTEFVIFSDANTLLNKDCVQNMLAHYSNLKVGGVAGEKKIVTRDSKGTVSHGEGLYWKYESFIKYLDSELYTTVGAAGELFSIRASLYTPLPGNIIIEDFVQSLLLCTKGYVVKYEPLAYSEERASLSVKDEMERKIRITAGAFQAMGILKELFNVFRYPVVSFQFISHRILRWTLCPLALIITFFSSLALYFVHGSTFYGYTLLLQVLFYLMGFTGWYLAEKDTHVKLLNLPFYFLFINYCVFAGFARFMGKKQDVKWKKAVRPGKI